MTRATPSVADARSLSGFRMQPPIWTGYYQLLDGWRQAQGEALAAIGLGPTECPYTTVDSDRLWRLREYGEGTGGQTLLIVAAPIKRPYIWDLAPEISAVRRCLDHGFRVFLLEWLPAAGDAGKAGLEAYAGRSIEDAVARVTRRTGGDVPFLMGHSLGGTLAAIHAALAGDRVRGLVLLATPLCFAPGTCRFRDGLMRVMPASIGAIDVVPGSLLTHISACASPDIFVWSRARDAGRSFGNARASDTVARVERWALDELPLSGALVREIFQDLYRDNRFCSGRLVVAGRQIKPADLTLPTLAVASTADGIAPPACVVPLLDAMTTSDRELIEHGEEVGVGLQHLGILIGRRAHANLWPRILGWLRQRS